MKFIQVFDPAMCCNTGVFGLDVDQQQVDFSAELDWAKQQGVEVQCFNLSQQPMEFANNQVVREVLERTGEETLPLILVEGEVALSSCRSASKLSVYERGIYVKLV